LGESVLQKASAIATLPKIGLQSPSTPLADCEEILSFSQLLGKKLGVASQTCRSKKPSAYLFRL
jgi:hypothetical protein